MLHSDRFKKPSESQKQPPVFSMHICQSVANISQLILWIFCPAPCSLTAQPSVVTNIPADSHPPTTHPFSPRLVLFFSPACTLCLNWLKCLSPGLILDNFARNFCVRGGSNYKLPLKSSNIGLLYQRRGDKANFQPGLIYMLTVRSVGLSYGKRCGQSKHTLL